MEEIITEVDPRILFDNYIKKHWFTRSMIAVNLDISKHHLYEILKCHRPLTEKNRKKLNELLNTNF